MASIAISVGLVALQIGLQFLVAPKPQDTEGPRLGDKRVMSSAPGTPILLNFGKNRIAGNVIWATDKEEIRTVRKVGGKGGRSSTNTTYAYFANFALGFCEGIGVEIEADQLAVRSGRFEDGAAMAAASERSVNHHRSWLQVQMAEALGHEHWLVVSVCHGSTTPPAYGSCQGGGGGLSTGNHREREDVGVPQNT